jgi:hypothetical protein
MKITRKTVKVHFIFSFALAIILLIGLAPRMVSGQGFFPSLLGALSDIRPVEWMMFILFWVVFAKNNLEQAYFQPPQTLGLADRDNG